MNTLPLLSTHHPASSFGLNLANPLIQYKVNYFSAIQREQANLQLLKQMQEMHYQKQLQSFYAVQQQLQSSVNSYCKQSLTNRENELTSSQSVSQGLLSNSSLKASPIDQSDSPVLLKVCISKMLHFFVTKFDKVSKEEVSQEKAKYASHPVLLKLFDKLAQRYSASGKSREDMIRSLLRGALRFLKDTYRIKFHLTSKAASIKLCQKYFKPKGMENSNIDFEDEDQVLSFLLPYKKNSRNKTPNTRFITEIFASEEFCQDYMGYISSYDAEFEKDNNTKLSRFSEFLLKCVENNTIEKVQNYKRLPWLKTWQEATKIVALELLDKKLQNSLNKKIQEKETRKQQKH